MGGYLNTGTSQGAILGALASGVAYGIGHKVPGFEGASYAEPGKLVAKSLTHGVTQGLIAKAGGGRFEDGAVGAFAASIGGPSVARAGRGIRQAMAAAALGGTVSVIGGGKFANGAMAAAWVNLFNHQPHAGSRFRFQDSIDTIEGMDISEREKGKIFAELNGRVRVQVQRMYAMDLDELGDFFGRLSTDPGLREWRQGFVSDLQKLQVYASARASGTLALDAYGSAGIAGSSLGAATSPMARGIGAGLQIFSFRQMFSPTQYTVTFSCVGHPLTTCRTQVSR